MRHLYAIFTFATSAVFSMFGCGGTDDHGTPGGEGGSSPTSSTISASSSSATGSGGGPAAAPCVDTGDCEGGRNSETCSVQACVNGYCTWIFDAFGVLCGSSEAICDGMGHCGNWMPPESTECYEPTLLVASCPLCDDGDPATADNCVADPASQSKHCEHAIISDGQPCGFNYTMKGGVCCPHNP